MPLVKAKVRIVPARNPKLGMCYAVNVPDKLARDYVTPDGWCHFAYVWACKVGSPEWIRGLLFAAEVHPQIADKWMKDRGKKRKQVCS